MWEFHKLRSCRSLSTRKGLVCTSTPVLLSGALRTGMPDINKSALVTEGQHVWRVIVKFLNLCRGDRSQEWQIGWNRRTTRGSPKFPANCPSAKRNSNSNSLAMIINPSHPRSYAHTPNKLWRARCNRPTWTLKRPKFCCIRNILHQQWPYLGLWQIRRWL